jgi:hypothetical protein
MLANEIVRVLTKRQYIDKIKPMKKNMKHDKVTDQLRQIIADSGMTMGEVSRAAEIDKTGLSRFLSGERGVSARVLDKIGELYGLRIAADRPRPNEDRK